MHPRSQAASKARWRRWKYVAVRRDFTFLERSIYEGTQWVVFEPDGIGVLRIRELRARTAWGSVRAQYWEVRIPQEAFIAALRMGEE